MHEFSLTSMFRTFSAWSTSSTFKRVRLPCRMNLSDSWKKAHLVSPVRVGAAQLCDEFFHLDDFAQPVLDICGQRR
jgi:hypothetical protein